MPHSFYAKLLGWKIAVDEGMDYGLFSTDEGPPVGGIGLEGPAGSQVPGIVACFPVQDLDAAVNGAKRLGASIVLEPWEVPGLGRMALLADPEGNRVGLMPEAKNG